MGQLIKIMNDVLIETSIYKLRFGRPGWKIQIEETIFQIEETVHSPDRMRFDCNARIEATVWSSRSKSAIKVLVRVFEGD